MEDLDIQLKLLAGIPIHLYDKDNKTVCIFYPPKLKDMVDYGYIPFLQKAALVCTNFIKEQSTEEHTYTLHNSWQILLSNVEYVFQFQTALALFIKEIVMINPENMEITIIDKDYKFTDKIITVEHCDFLAKLVAMSLWMDDIEIQTNKNESEAVQKLKSKLKRYKKILQKENKDSGESLDLADLISIVISKNFGINFLNVWELSYYAFYSLFLRLQINESYDIGVKSLLAGAKQEDVELKPWLCKLNKGGT
jgi:hypothetical protein